MVTSPTLQREARALGDPTRHAIFQVVAQSPNPVDVAELTEHFGLNHNAIRQHLGKLLEAGLLVEARARGGGPGRPRLLFSLAPGVDSRWGVTGPYERISVLLTQVIRTGESPQEVGRQAGVRLKETVPETADGIGTLVEGMARQGFGPEVHRHGQETEVVLQTCPFATTAEADPEIVCAVHLGIAEGLAEGTDAVVDGLDPEIPRIAGCRLHLHTEARP
jgi:predicted ArsR family transcriptional regulator